MNKRGFFLSKIKEKSGAAPDRNLIRKVMKKLLATLSAILALSASTASASDRIIDFSALPQPIQQFAKANFKDKKVAVVKEDTNFFGAVTEGYDIVFADGTEIDFSSDGTWREVSAKTSSVPNAIIPEQILGYIRDNFNSSPVVQIERKRYGYKLELASKQELKFNKQFVFLGMD